MKKMQCSAKCSTKLYESEEYANKIKEALQDGTLEQVEQPVCPDCGAPLAFNIVCENYVEEGYLPSVAEIYKVAHTYIESSFMHFGIGSRNEPA